MNHKFLHIALIVILLVLAVACNNRQTGEVVSNDKEKVVDKDAPYVEGNKKILQWETEEMDLFVKRYGWNMTKTGTGMYIEILDPGTGKNFTEGDKIAMDYQMFLLSGEMIYNSKDDGIKEFTVGRSEEITGLHEAATLLKPGAKARLVIPSHLAYGVAGDGGKVNGRMPIAMTIDIEDEPFPTLKLKTIQYSPIIE